MACFGKGWDYGTLIKEKKMCVKILLVYFWKQIQEELGMELWNRAASQFNFQPPLQTNPYTDRQIIANTIIFRNFLLTLSLFIIYLFTNIYTKKTKYLVFWPPHTHHQIIANIWEIFVLPRLSLLSFFFSISAVAGVWYLQSGQHSAL